MLGSAAALLSAPNEPNRKRRRADAALRRNGLPGLRLSTACITLG
jgi:hypothetical protein